MRKFNFIELMDCKWFPNLFRDMMTDVLENMSANGTAFDRIIPVIERAQAYANTNKIVDLCSGGGGPWKRLFPKLRKTNRDVQLIFTDMYPNKGIIKEVESEFGHQVQYLKKPIDATGSLADLDGVRTFFGSFHHMNPYNAKKILNRAAIERRGIIVAEAFFYPPKFAWITLPIQIILLPIQIIFLWVQLVKVIKGNMFIRLLQVFFTFIIPLIPISMAYDTFISSTRVYMKNDLKELTKDINYKNYRWEVKQFDATKEERTALVYVLGYPVTDG